MYDIAKIALTFAVIVLLMRRKYNVGYVLLAASALICVLYLMTPVRILKTMYGSITSVVTIELTVALTFIRMLEMLLRENDVLKRMSDTMRGVLRKKRFVMISMPLLIGTLPSVGGAYFSCPMVEESAKGLGLSPEDKAFTNYWYRHPWELILPLYPGIVLASLITGIGLRQFMILNLSFAVTMLLVGPLFSMKGVNGTFEPNGKMNKSDVLSFLPLVALIAMVMVFKVRLSVGLVGVVCMLLLYYRYDRRRVFGVLKYGFSPDLLVLILGVVLFKEILESSGAVGNLSKVFIQYQIPVLSILIILPFISGFLTGFTLAFVGSTFPLFLNMPAMTPYAYSLAFACGFIGVLLSPVHVCLVLTREFFKADMWGIYKKILPAVLLIFLVTLVQYVILNLYK
ncbi:MAG: DUF401 family protein [Magnetococcales bacterium]|uniref:DUF401 family protein n=1 Tax=Candidatus Magnetobacterium casense TaxID=1455061 RepID=A0ABS6S0Q5_9BACT|nr:DUF401 family protein [Candidatus Magnetobacterium casensis]MBF0608468.1 DUF401 family protein [Nitrospirota bacterium]MBV6342217.1 DUF401 family protein [Candidatus Magnetobacterium casensis]